jgi:hypothetical protein
LRGSAQGTLAESPDQLLTAKHRPGKQRHSRSEVPAPRALAAFRSASYCPRANRRLHLVGWEPDSPLGRSGRHAGARAESHPSPRPASRLGRTPDTDSTARSRAGLTRSGRSARYAGPRRRARTPEEEMTP